MGGSYLIIILCISFNLDHPNFDSHFQIFTISQLVYQNYCFSLYVDMNNFLMDFYYLYFLKALNHFIIYYNLYSILYLGHNLKSCCLLDCY